VSSAIWVNGPDGPQAIAFIDIDGTSFPSALGALQRAFYREDGGEGEFGNVTLNDVLALCIAGAVVVVIATILGAVERLWTAVAAIAGRCVACKFGCHGERDPPRHPENRRHGSDPVQHILHKELLATR
jgi:hypothetical protein